MSVDAVNASAAKACILGWFIGLAYYNWFAHQPPHVALWLHFVLAFVGMFAASILIGGALALLAGVLTKRTTGSWDGSPDFFAWGVFIGPVLAFFAAGYALQVMST
jgi:hypothetical protein